MESIVVIFFWFSSLWKIQYDVMSTRLCGQNKLLTFIIEYSKVCIEEAM
uniref:Uncharacterized protein n=1 Tax=Rhizophora mucronata TaxID=61149 RepID=A0A2P2QL41_RHIMU